MAKLGALLCSSQLPCAYGEHIQANEIADPDTVTLLGEQHGTLVGYAQLRWRKGPSWVVAQQPGEIHRLYVLSDAHGLGVAHDLMYGCIDEMTRRGSDVAWLGVWEANPRAIAFYRKFHFVEVGEHVFLLGKDRQRDIIMVRPCACHDSPSTYALECISLPIWLRSIRAVAFRGSTAAGTDVSPQLD